MDYMKQLNRFFECSEAECLPASAQIVYLHLLNINNRLHWRAWFNVANSTLERLTGLQSNKSIVAAKNRLKQIGLIDYQSDGKKITRYHIIPITTQDATQDSTQDATQDSTQDATQDSTQDATQDSTQDATQDSTQDATQDSTHIKRLDKTKRDGYMADGFMTFWAAYPRKDKKAEAAKSYAKIAPDKALQARMLQSIEAFKRTEQWQEADGKYIPYAATWLNQRRWEDEIEATAEPTRAYYGDGMTDEEEAALCAKYDIPV